MGKTAFVANISQYLILKTGVERTCLRTSM